MALADTLKTDLNAPVVRPSQQYEKETIAPLREQMMTSLKSEEDVGRKKEIQQASSQANLSASMSTYDTQASEKLHNDPNLIKYQEAIDQKSKAAFIPDQENPQRLATVLAITNLLGIAIGGKGKNSAQTALAAQNGMLEGYQQGRADIIKQQKDIFDTNQKQLDKTIENLHRGFQDALALAPTDRKAAEEKAMSTINKENADFLRELYNKTGLVGASKTIAELLKQAESRQNLMRQEEMKMIRTPHELEIERHELEMERQGRRGLDIKENKQGRGGDIPKDKETRNEHRFRFEAMQNVDDVLNDLQKPEVRRLIGPENNYMPDVILSLQKGYPELAQKLARFQAEEFKTGGKSLTWSEQRILGPIYNWRSLTANSLEDNLKEASRIMNREQRILESAYPGLQDFSNRYQDAVDGVGVSEKPISPGAYKARPVETKSNVSIPTVTTKEQYDALPRNSFYLEDGETYRKP
jgi:hypothetical protein